MAYNFSIRKTIPNGNKEYITKGAGGYSTCIVGSPTRAGANTLANCVGYACGRFNEIYNKITGNASNKYAALNCNAENFIERAISLGLKIVSDPVPGGIMVFQKGATLSGNDGAGHVMAVEEVYSKDDVYTSESGYGSSTPFWNSRRKRYSNNWGMGSAYKYRGCIVNPAVKEVSPTPPTPSGDDYKVIKSIPGYINSDNAKNRVHSNSTVPAGTYKVFNKANGMINVTRTAGEPGWWINPGDNVSTPTPTPTPTKIIPGDKVTLVGNSRGIYWSADSKYNGRRIPDQYKGKVYTVSQVRDNPGVALLKELVSWVYYSDLKK